MTAPARARRWPTASGALLPCDRRVEWPPIREATTRLALPRSRWNCPRCSSRAVREKIHAIRRDRLAQPVIPMAKRRAVDRERQTSARDRSNPDARRRRSRSHGRRPHPALRLHSTTGVGAKCARSTPQACRRRAFAAGQPVVEKATVQFLRPSAVRAPAASATSRWPVPRPSHVDQTGAPLARKDRPDRPDVGLAR